MRFQLCAAHKLLNYKKLAQLTRSAGDFVRAVCKLDQPQFFSSAKNKLEISQRFHFFEGQTGILIDEAYRFLQNKWREKQLQTKRKDTDGINVVEGKSDDSPSSNNGLLKKKRQSNPVKNKKII